MTTLPSEAVKAEAQHLGFAYVGITHAQPAPTLHAYLRWIDAGMHGSMGYMAREDRIARRRDLNVVLPGAQSLVMVGLDYGAQVPEFLLSDPSRGRIAAYAWGLDYHDLMTPRLEQLAAFIADLSADAPPTHKVYVDTGAILERAHAQQAGMGFIGKNTLLIHPRRGSSFFLGEVVTTAAFDIYDAPLPKATMCGTCTRCLTACPTEAFPAPHVLDARRCISYLTIEHKGWIDPTLRPLMGNWVYGCDVCQDVCPWEQRFARPATDPGLHPIHVETHAAPPLLDLLTLNNETFKARYTGSPIYRIKRERLVRNACIAAGNWGHRRAAEALDTLLHDDSALVRGHAAWALTQVIGLDATRSRLESLRDHDPDPDVRGEAARLLE